MANEAAHLRKGQRWLAKMGEGAIGNGMNIGRAINQSAIEIKHDNSHADTHLIEQPMVGV